MTTPEGTPPPSSQPPSPAPPSAHEAVLRTLSPMLRRLERNVRAWLEGKHVTPLDLVTHATLEGLANDLKHQADDLDAEQPLLVVMLMGGTGVGKSTLMNALAGGAVAQASFQRPTTRDPVVYYHDSIKTDKFNPLLRTMRLAQHDRPALKQKVIVDLPDLDSNVIAHREIARQLLGVADVVLSVGSQEKYHDQIVWDEFLKQRKRRAFAFVMNKWDRCLHAGAAGKRPDEDLEDDLKGLGFEKPLIFRTNAQYWVDKANGEQREPEPPQGEQFLDLVNWLEMGLNRMEIDAIKARGTSQLLADLERELQKAAPPDLTEVATRTRAAWEKKLGDEARETADILLQTLTPYQGEIEHHFTVQSQRHFRGMMDWYLTTFAKLKYFGANVAKNGFSLIPRPGAGAVERPDTWDIGEFTRRLSGVAGERQLDARCKALANDLLLKAEQAGFPLSLLQSRTENAAKIDWRGRFAEALVAVIEEVEQQWSHPTGFRRFLQVSLILMGNWLPPVVLLLSYAFVLWHIFVTGDLSLTVTQLLVPLFFTLGFLVVMQMLIVFVLPLRWARIRNEFQGLLEERLRKSLTGAYAGVPVDLAEELRAERKKVEDVVKDVRDVAAWLQQRQQSASITGLYGN
jgi:hypothetical protein